jgi:hypothetical protein
VAEFWAEQIWVVRLLLLVQFCLFVISLLRFAKLFGWLYVNRRGATDVAYALSHRAPREPTDSAKPLDVAEGEFLYLCKKCSIEVESTKRASWLAFLLILIAAAYRASTLYRVDCGSAFCLVYEMVAVFRLLSAGLSVSAIVYAGSSFFERKLSKRKNDWKHFFARSRNQPAAGDPLVD